MTSADIVILGGGSGGYACALRASQLGLSAILIEADKLGGTCLHRGCIPTKALLHAAEIADAARDSAHFGVKASLDGIDMPAVNSYRDGVVSRLHKGLQGLVKSRNVTYVEGHGHLTSATTVEVDGQTYTGRHVVLATGSYARSLPGLEISGRIMTSDQALNLDYVPDRVIILGGGVIGVEFASVWRSFGSQVHIVEGLPRLVPAEDEALSKAFERAYRKRGITFTTGVRFASATQDDSGVHVTLEDGSTHEADLLLVAVGRGPRTEGLGFEQVGISMERGWVLVDDHLQTNIPGVYAVGDITPGLQLAHRGSRTGSTSPNISPGSARNPSATSTSPASPTPSRRSARSASPRPRPVRRMAPTRSRSTNTTSVAMARARSWPPQASSSSSNSRTAPSSECT